MVRFLVMLLFLVSFTSARAQQPAKASWEIGVGPSLPSSPSDFADYWKLGPHVSAGFSYPARSSVSVVFLFDWSRHAWDWEKMMVDYGYIDYGDVMQGVEVSGGSATILSGTANLKISLGVDAGTAVPYLLAGIGIHRWSISDVHASGPGGTAYVPASSSQTALAVQVGVGASFRTTKNLDVFIDGRYLVGLNDVDGRFSESTGSFPIRLGIRTR